MARKRREEASGGSAPWLTTFSDLMNLLLCFFVLLFSMSTVDLEKFQMVVQSIQSSFSIMPAGGSAIVHDGNLIASGISQLENLDVFYREANASGKTDTTVDDTSDLEETELREQYLSASMEESEKMADQIQEMLTASGIADKVELDATAQYVRLTLNGALLFNSGKSEIREEAIPLVEKLSAVVSTYSDNMISVEGHTDNVPISSEKYEDNDVLSAYRALAVKNYFVEHTVLEPSKIRATSCGEYTPIADNGTNEGRALNRRVEIKVYNSFNLH